MAADPTITGVRSQQVIYGGQPITPFSGVTVTDPTPGATDTVGIGVYRGGVLLDDGAGFDGLMVRPFDAAAAHLGITDYFLQGTASQVTAELDALVLTTVSPGYPAQVEIGFGVTSSSGASSANSGITVQASSVAPDAQGIIDVGANGQRVALQPFNVAFNHRHADTAFVFSPGDELAVVRGFQVQGPHHSTLELSGADFGDSVANVLLNTGDVGGSAFVTDPVTGDAVRLAGVTAAQLRNHPKDFGFT